MKNKPNLTDYQKLRILYDKALNDVVSLRNDVVRLSKENAELKDKISRYEKELDLDYVDDNFASKEKIKEYIKKLKEMTVDGTVFTTAVNFAIIEFKDLLGSEEK